MLLTFYYLFVENSVPTIFDKAIDEFQVEVPSLLEQYEGEVDPESSHQQDLHVKSCVTYLNSYVRILF